MNNDASQNAHPKAGNQPPHEGVFGPVVYRYSRQQALAEGVQFEASSVAAEAGFKCPVFITDGVRSKCVKVPDSVSCQDEEGQLWNLLTILHRAIRNAEAEIDRLTFQLYVRNSADGLAKLVPLAAECGAKDFDDPTPAITIMMADED